MNATDNYEYTLVDGVGTLQTCKAESLTEALKAFGAGIVVQNEYKFAATVQDSKGRVFLVRWQLVTPANLNGATKHTPLPWKALPFIDERYGKGVGIYGADNLRICEVICTGKLTAEQHDTNIRLIVNAPDLLATMERIVDRIKYHAKNEDAQTLAAIALEAGDAIAKAKGPQ